MSELQPVEEIWVNTNEAASITGYNQKYLNLLGNKIRKLPEEERPIRLLYRTRRYEFWLPDLVAYLSSPRHGPQRKRNSTG
jgi:hypothetical protein